VADGVEFAQTRNSAERHSVATACAVALKLDIPILIDGMDNAADHAYNGWPERLYVLDEKGTVAYKGGKGPYGFEPEELHNFLAEYLPKPE
jgi:hypothetical protein